jgi:hypothetical protein
MEPLLKQLQVRFPSLTYMVGPAFYWSPQSQEIFYKPDAPDTQAAWSLLHETSHALLHHSRYTMDFELVLLETAAWQRASLLAAELGISIDNDHIQDCLDTYRDWLYARSQCPRCSNKGIQQSNARQYGCFNCGALWKVAPSRFCRAYRVLNDTSLGIPITFATTN